MEAPLRIYRGQPPTKGGFSGATAADEQPPPPIDQYLGRVVKMIPGEVVASYLLGAGVIPADSPRVLAGWAVICLLALIVRARLTRDPERGLSPQWTNVILAGVAYVIWLYNLGGPFQAFGVYVPYIGTLLLLSWTLFLPLVYMGD